MAGGFGGRAGNGNAGGSSGTGGTNSGGSNAGAGNSAAGASAAGASSNSDGRQGGMASAMGVGQTGSGNTAQSQTQSQSAPSGVMSGLQSAVSAARDARNGNLSGIQQGIAKAVSSAFGSPAAAAQTDGTRAPNATPGQKAAYNSGYRNETNAGLTRSAFGAVPGVGSLVGEGIARTAMAAPAGMADNEAAAYSTGVSGAKDAGIGSGTRAAASTLGSVLGGPIGAALASLALGGFSYSQQRAANPAAFAGMSSPAAGPVSGAEDGTVSLGNAGSNGVNVPSGMAQAMMGPGDDASYGLANDYSDAYNSYQRMNLGRI